MAVFRTIVPHSVYCFSPFNPPPPAHASSPPPPPPPPPALQICFCQWISIKTKLQSNTSDIECCNNNDDWSDNDLRFQRINSKRRFQCLSSINRFIVNVSTRFIIFKNIFLYICIGAYCYQADSPYLKRIKNIVVWFDTHFEIENW